RKKACFVRSRLFYAANRRRNLLLIAAHGRIHALAQILAVLIRRLDPPRTGKALFPVAVIHVVDTDRAARGGRMHELVVADIDADMRERAAHGVEEHQIARLEVADATLFTDAAHFLGAARQRHTERVLEDVADKAAAIEPRIRRVT